MRHLRLMARPLPVKASCENTYALYLSIGFIRKVFTS
ncbi:MAG: hypothetical protein QG656_1536, partial [Candidatus Hydrogenedentes bacterium]|nr:hypothetical protein [Candidatus Hydrogenedentota bacterium]